MLQCLKFRVPKVNSDLSNFVSSVIKLNVYISELKQNHEIDILAENSGRQLIRAVVQDILPGDILDKYQILTGVEYPTLEQFISNAQKVAERICRKQKNKQRDGNNSGATSNNLSQNADNIVTSPIPSTISAVNTQPSKRKTKVCLFCGSKDHSSSKCPKFATVKDRTDVLMNRKGYDPCNKCLFEHKQDGKCMPCTIKGCTSQKTHSALTCPLILDKINPKTSNNAKAVTVTTNKRCCSVALPTFTAQIECSVNDNSLQAVGVLLDTAAQQSLIHREVVERLNIEPIRQEYTTLVGFGMNRPMAKNYDVVRVKLFKSGYTQTSTITCLVVDRPPAICNMTGICQLAKKLAKKGADIADRRLLDQKRDILISDILVGADYFMTVNCINKPPVRILGSYLLNTIFGQSIIGKISGSTRLTDSKAVTQLSIVHVATNFNDERNELHNPGLLSCDESLDSFNGNEIISEFSSFSDIGINLYDREQLDSDALKHFKNTVRYHENLKQFECGIPW